MKRILVIEDDEQVRALLVEILSIEGYDVAEAADGKAGLKSFRERPADAVITDIVMPEKEGVETIATLRREFPKLGIVAISGGGRNGPRDYLSVAQMMGARRAVAKPFTASEILDAVKEVLSDPGSTRA